MLRVAIAGFVLMVMSISGSGAALAQWGWEPWYDDGPRYRYKQQRPYYQPPGDGFWGDNFWGDSARPRRPKSQGRRFRSGGPRPAIAPIAPARIAFPSNYAVGSIVIDHKGRQLFLIQSPVEALRYRISVGREGFGWAGTEKVSKIVEWPSWHPPASMRARDPRLPVHMSGGLRNPLGAKAIYLGNTLYRIHGTNAPKSIGRAASSGCFRMVNGHIVDLASRVGIGTTVTVVRRLPRALERMVADQVAGRTVRLKPAVKASAARPARPAVQAPAAAVEEDEPAGDEVVEMEAWEEPAEAGPAGEGGGAPEQRS